MMYHGYENGFWTLGRQALLDPMEWNEDGWPVADGGDLSRPLRKPRSGRALPHGMTLSDDFAGETWAPSGRSTIRARTKAQRFAARAGRAGAAGKGAQPRDTSPLCFIAGDLATRSRSQVELRGEAQAGVLLFYNRRLYCGLGFDAQRFTMHRYGLERTRAKPAGAGRKLWLRMPTTATSSRSTTVQTAGPGPNSTCRWKSPATTTMWPAISWPCGRRFFAAGRERRRFRSSSSGPFLRPETPVPRRGPPFAGNCARFAAVERGCRAHFCMAPAGT